MARQGVSIFFTHLYKYDEMMNYQGIDRGWPQEFKGELRKLGVRAESMELDFSDRGAPSALLDKVDGVFGKADILVNNATYCVEASFRELSAELLSKHCDINIVGTCMLSAEFAKRLEGRRGGRIINLVSGQDKSPEPGNLAYIATKGAVSAFTKTMALEVASLGITVNAVDPGPTDTGWMSDETKAYLKSKFPLKRIGTPEDAGRLVSFLASDEAQWVTGQIIHSDGGFWS